MRAILRVLVLILGCMAFTGMMFGTSSSSVTLNSSLNPSTYGSLVMFTATVTPTAATGTVTFKDGSTTLGTGTIGSGTATYSTSTLSAGSHAITAAYGGDSNYNGSTSSVVTETINAVPQIVTTSLPVGKVGASYSAPLAASAGTTPYTWSISSGSLSGGLSLDPSMGVITGTPTVAGTSNFTVQVTDADSVTATRSLSIVVTFLPSGWADTDVGQVYGVNGIATYSNGTFTVTSDGAAIGGTADGMHFAYQTLVGDGSIVARLASTTYPNSAQTGVMIRETLNPGATDAFVYYSFHTYMQDRATTGAAAVSLGSSSAYGIPEWLKLVRAGNIFTGFASSDGINWTQLGSTTVAMAQTVYIGLAVSGVGSLDTATFDSVSVNSTAAPAPVITGLSATTASVGSQVEITGNNFGATQGGSVVLLNRAPITINSWSNTSIVFTVPAGGTSGQLMVSVAPSMNDSNPIYLEVTTQPLLTPWLDQDVGQVYGVNGIATYSNGTFTVTSDGENIGGTADGMHFAYQTLVGDGSIVARLASTKYPNSAQAGVMIRETLNPGATDAFVYYSFHTYMQDRTTTGAAAVSLGSSSAYGIPEWLELVRAGNTFTGFVSSDGINWTQLGSTTIAMAQTVYIGLAVSGAGSVLETATFDSVSINSTVAPAPVITGLSATTASVGSQVEITGNNFGAAQGGSIVLLNGTPITINGWSNTAIVVTIPAGATSGQLMVTVAPSMNDSNPIYLEVTTQPLLTPWLDQDVGQVYGVAGIATYSNGTFTLTGDGAAIGGTADGMHFVYQTLVGDGSIVARVTSSSYSSTQAGVMIRETLNPGAADASVYYSSSHSYMQDRPTTGASVVYPGSPYGVGAALPDWLKLVRAGSTFTGFASSDGINWTQLGSTTVAMAQTVYIGLAESGVGTVATATFDSLSINSTVGPAPVITGLSATTASVGSQIEITGNNFGAAQGGSAVLLNRAPTTIIVWSNTSIVFTIPAGATSGPVMVSVAPSMNDSNPIYLEVTTQPLPTPWLDQDVGQVYGVTGSATYSNGVFTVTGDGAAIVGTADGMHFVYQTLTGDGSIVARLTSRTVPCCTQAGVMIRETLNPGAADASVYYLNGYSYMQDRPTTGASVVYPGSPYGVVTALPDWLKLVRAGSTFTGFASPDGINWTQLGSTTVSMAQTVYIGLAESAEGNVATATFDSVTVVIGTTPFVSGVTPIVGTIGTPVTIVGSNFGTTQGTSTVQFNGVLATSITSWSSSQILAAVPSAAPNGTGPVVVTVNSISSPITAGAQFTVINPVITSLEPPSGPPAGIITINGSGFGQSIGSFSGVSIPGVVSVNGVSTIIASVCPQLPGSVCWSDAQIQAFIPGNATIGSASVTVTNGGFVSNAVPFTVTNPPVITSLSPTTGEPATVITIGGSGFGATQSNSTVAVGGIPAPVSSWSDGQIVASVPAIPMNGIVTVTVAGITANGPLFIYNAINQLTASNGAVTTYDSGDFGNSWRIYSSAGPGCSTCSVRGNVLNTYDTNGNLLTTTDANGNTITYTYDGNNNMASQTAQLNGSGVTTSYTYNSFAEVLTMTDPLGNTTTNTYDANGNLLTVSSPAPNGQTPPSVTQFTYNTLGELTQILDPLSHPTTIAYYPTGLIQSITDAQNHVTSYNYDSRGNRTSGD